MTEREQLVRDAHAVFLPAIDEASIPGHISDHLAAGGTSVLIGESREEYVAREMSPERRLTETGEWFLEMTSEIRERAGGKALVAIDHELGGIQRLHALATALPSPTEAASADEWSIKTAAARLAEECNDEENQQGTNEDDHIDAEPDHDHPPPDAPGDSPLLSGRSEFPTHPFQVGWWGWDGSSSRSASLGEPLRRSYRHPL